MCVARFSRAWLARQKRNKRRFALHQPLQSTHHIADLGKGVKALGAAAQLAGSLRAAQEQDANQRRFRPAEIEGLAQPVLEFTYAAVRIARASCKSLVFEPMQCLAHLILVEVHHRLAVRALVAGIDQPVHGEGVVVGRGNFLFHEGAEDASFGGGELDGLGEHDSIVTFGSRSFPCSGIGAKNGLFHAWSPSTLRTDWAPSWCNSTKQVLVAACGSS